MFGRGDSALAIIGKETKIYRMKNTKSKQMQLQLLKAEQEAHNTLVKSWEYNKLRAKHLIELQSDASRTRRFRSAELLQKSNPELFKVNLFQLVREVCELFILSSLESLIWLHFCLKHIDLCNETTIRWILFREAFRVKATLSPITTSLIVAYFKQYKSSDLASISGSLQ
jgi:hypothetical protein